MSGYLLSSSCVLTATARVLMGIYEKCAMQSTRSPHISKIKCIISAQRMKQALCWKVKKYIHVVVE